MAIVRLPHDQLFWPCSKDSSYFVKSSYNCLREIVDHTNPNPSPPTPTPTISLIGSLYGLLISLRESNSSSRKPPIMPCLQKKAI